MIRAWRRDTASELGLAVLGAIILLIVWEMSVRVGVFDQAVVPTFTEAASTLIQLLALPGFWTMIGQTLESWLIGLVLVIIVGIPVGLLLGSSKTLDSLFSIQVELVRPVPPVVLLPIVLLLLGATLPMKLVLVMYGALWPVIIQARAGVRSTEPLMLDAARSYRLPSNYVATFVRLPSALPMIMTGVRISATMALVVSVVAEMVGGAPGIGNQILIAQSRGDAPLTFALILTTGILGLIVGYIFLFVEKRVLFWHPSVRGS